MRKPTAWSSGRDEVPLKADAAAVVEGAWQAMMLPVDAATNPASSAEYLARVRQGGAISREPEPVGRVSEVTIGAGLGARVYEPALPGIHSLVVYLHGGGWVAGGRDTNDGTCRRLCNLTNSVVVNVDYRLAPEHRFPAAVTDTYDAIEWAARHAAEYSADASQLVLVGSSAGANLAAAAALRARDESGPGIRSLVLIYPVLDAALETESTIVLAAGYLLERRLLEWYWQQYCDESERCDPLASPMAASSLAGLPPTLVITAEYDPLRDEGEAFAARISREGGSARAVRFDGQVHGFAALLGVIADADLAHDLIAAEIRLRTQTSHDTDVSTYEREEHHD
ncbi:MAG: Esterase/lipase/thioesterase [Subtercola sp.]|nr:Esterase/lipase/thioesterase [Subtercola sp.]